MNASYQTVLHRVRRSSERQEISRASTLRGDDGAPFDVVLEDVSATGCRISGTGDLAPHDTVTIGLAGVGPRSASVVWARDGQAGCEFDVPLGVQQLNLAQNAATVVSAPFNALPVPTAGTVAVDPAPLSYRARLGIIILAAAASWGLTIALIRLALWLLA